MKKYKKRLFIFMIILLILIIIYNIINNNRVKVVTQDVVINNLPDSFDNFTILQISDLHGKVFGKEQSNLAKIINNLDYDMIAITGDMQDRLNPTLEPLLQLLDKIENKENIFYIPGNHGPDYNEDIKNRGAISLETAKEIKKGEDSIWVYDFFGESGFTNGVSHIDNNDIKIAVTHYPWNEDFYKLAKDTIGEYDLVLAGHYHGGQVRIPFYGAIFVPDINEPIYFPDQNLVSGLNTYGRYNQYVSRGLGASGKYGFRIFNTPEINLITLKKGS